MMAAQQGDEEIVRRLLEYKPDTSQTDRFGKRAADRAATQGICYLIQSAGIDQCMSKVGAKMETKGKPTSKPKSAAPTQRGGEASVSRTSAVGMTTRRTKGSPHSGPVSEEQVNIMKYYREKFMEQIAVLSSRLSQRAAQQLEGVIQQDLNRSETFLRGLVGSELNVLTDRMKEQIDQHVLLKTKLAAAKAGVADIADAEPAEPRLSPTKEPQPPFPISPKNQGYTAGIVKKSAPTRKQAAQKTITRLNRTIDSLIDSKEDMLQASGKGMFSPRSLPKDKQELYGYLKREITMFVGQRIDEVASSLAEENKEMIAGLVKGRMDYMEKIVRADIKRYVNDMGKELKARVDCTVNEKLTRIAKQAKTAVSRMAEDSSKGFTERSSQLPQPVTSPRGPSQGERPLVSPKPYFNQLTDLHTSIRKLDSSYTAMLDSGMSTLRPNLQPKLAGSTRKYRPAFTERKGRNLTERVRSMSNRSRRGSGVPVPAPATARVRPDVSPLYAGQLSMSAEKAPEQSKTEPVSESVERPRKVKYYTSMQELAEEGQNSKIKYSHVKPHNSKVIPSSKYTNSPRTEMKQPPPPISLEGEETKSLGSSLGRPMGMNELSPEPRYAGDAGRQSSPPSGGKMDQLLAKYSNTHAKDPAEELKGAEEDEPQPEEPPQESPAEPRPGEEEGQPLDEATAAILGVPSPDDDQQ